MTDEERLKASIDQIYTYGGSQYPRWRVVAVKSIRKILLNLDGFYSDLIPEIELEDEQRDLIHCQVRNGWFYEAVSQSEQAIEDLFSTMMNLGDMCYFAKNVVKYNATKVKKYIWDFKVDDLEYICKQFRIPYYPLDEPWENMGVFEHYKDAIVRIQKYIMELQDFHKKYYTDYCQYKHGLSVALTPMQNPLMKGDEERCEKMIENPLKGCLQTFHQGTIEQYQKNTGVLPAMGMLLKPEMQKHIRELHDEGNLLFFTMHAADMDEIVMVTEHACVLLETLWQNIIWQCEDNEDSEFYRFAFPTESTNRTMEMGVPK